MPDPARSAIIRRLNETTVTRENHGIEEDFLSSRVCYINRITDPPGYSPHGYKASKARRNSEAWISVGFFCAFREKACFLSGLYRKVKKGKKNVGKKNQSKVGQV